MESSFLNCKTDPLHTMGQIQSHGALLAFNSISFLLEYFSSNIRDFLPFTITELDGQTGPDLFPEHWNSIVEAGAKRGVHKIAIEGSLVEVNVAVHRQENHLILEFEPVEEDEAEWWNHTERVNFLERVEGARSVADCHRLLVRYMFEHTGFDRVMLYQFMPDMHGVVMEERCKQGAVSFLGLHFPAEDIPPNAQQFYRVNRQRFIADVGSESVPLVCAGEDADQLDLTKSMLRAVHPVHIQYLKNMDVVSSFSLSILVRGSLYGLLACHNTSCKLLRWYDRLAFEEIARLISLHLENLLDVRRREIEFALNNRLESIRIALKNTIPDTGAALARLLGLMQELFGSNSAWLHFEANDYFSGPMPESAYLEDIKSWFGSFDKGSITCHDRLPAHMRNLEAISLHASGSMFLPLYESSFVVFFRPELVQTISWAGDPGRHGDEYLTPRTSFETWNEQMRGISEPWYETDLEMATKLRLLLLQFLDGNTLSFS